MHGDAINAHVRFWACPSRAITLSFYFSKATDGPYKNGDEVVLGPFTAKEFEELKKKHGLPDWSKRF